MTDISAIFYGKSFNGDISKWDVTAAKTMLGMFADTNAFNSDISKWDVSSVTDMSYMFKNAQSFNRDISTWDVSKVTDMQYMFKGASSFNSDISNWDVSKVTDMQGMFDGATAFSRTLCGAWKVSTAEGKDDMFTGSSGKLCSGASFAWYRIMCTMIYDCVCMCIACVCECCMDVRLHMYQCIYGYVRVVMYMCHITFQHPYLISL